MGKNVSSETRQEILEQSRNVAGLNFHSIDFCIIEHFDAEVKRLWAMGDKVCMVTKVEKDIPQLTSQSLSMFQRTQRYGDQVSKSFACQPVSYLFIKWNHGYILLPGPISDRYRKLGATNDPLSSYTQSVKDMHLPPLDSATPAMVGVCPLIVENPWDQIII